MRGSSYTTAGPTSEAKDDVAPLIDERDETPPWLVKLRRETGTEPPAGGDEDGDRSELVDLIDRWTRVC